MSWFGNEVRFDWFFILNIIKKKNNAFCCAYAKKRRYCYISLWIENSDWLEVLDLWTAWVCAIRYAHRSTHAIQREHRHAYIQTRTHTDTNGVETQQQVGKYTNSKQTIYPIGFWFFCCACGNVLVLSRAICWNCRQVNRKLEIEVLVSAETYRKCFEDLFGSDSSCRNSLYLR